MQLALRMNLRPIYNHLIVTIFYPLALKTKKNTFSGQKTITPNSHTLITVLTDDQRPTNQ